MVNLRRFDPEDLDQVIHINQKCLPENYTHSFFMNLYEKFPESFLVAEVDEVIIGYIMCRIESGLSNLSLRSLSLAKRGHIISIAVLPDFQNKGVGRTLIEVALKAISAHYAAESCYLEVRVSNRKAIELYSNVGFEVQRTNRSYYSDGEGAYVMNKKI